MNGGLTASWLLLCFIKCSLGALFIGACGWLWEDHFIFLGANWDQEAKKVDLFDILLQPTTWHQQPSIHHHHHHQIHPHHHYNWDVDCDSTAQNYCSERIVFNSSLLILTARFYVNRCALWELLVACDKWQKKVSKVNHNNSLKPNGISF